MSAVIWLGLSCLVVIVDIVLGPADVYNLIYLTTGETPRGQVLYAIFEIVQPERRMVTVLLAWLPPSENIQDVSRVLPGAERKDEQCWVGNIEYIRRNTKWRMAIKKKSLGCEFTGIACLMEILACMLCGPNHSF